MQYLLVIDAGTGSGRAVLFDTKGNQLAVGQGEWTQSPRKVWKTLLSPSDNICLMPL